MVRITYDPAKRARTLAEREIDFEAASTVFDGATFEFEDRRRNFGERRVICFGRLAGRLVVIVYTDRGNSKRIISMRKANARERARFRELG